MIQTILSALTFNPKQVTLPFSWVGHLPFAATLVRETKPKILVELGTHTGNSYFTFCQAIKENSLPTRCYAVDTWEGEEHAGFYDESVFEAVSGYNSKNYSAFSKLLRTTFDEAANEFEEQSIDILHIDGLHTYEAVNNDYETWLPKLRDGGVILFHDTCCHHHDFGVWKLWEEIQQTNKYTFSFLHSHGLGVLVKGDGPIQNEFLAGLMSEKDIQAWREIFAKAGSDIEDTADQIEKENITAQPFLSNDQQFNEEQSSRLVYKSGEHICLKFEKLGKYIKYDQPLYLRFDPADRLALVCLEEINLIFQENNGTEIKQKLDHRSQLHLAGDLITSGKASDSHISTGIDPQFIIEPITMSENRLISVETTLSINTEPLKIATALKNLVNEREHSIEALQSSLNEREHSIEAQQSSLNEREHSIEALQSSLNEREHSIEALQSSLNEREHSIKAQQRELDTRRDKILRMQKSFSWQCTAPLRALRRLLKQK